MTGQLNGVALLLIAGYLTSVLFHGNMDALIAALKSEKGFLLWILALIAVYWVWRAEPLGQVGSKFASLALMATFLAVASNPQIKELVSSWSK